ncbi:MAG: class I SAM-dependent rRNA methyltransferase [Kofleriaceae bacterium]|nr:class I SAM-dependent rRNA methyltransferase [Kofleriaceae bacterium]
MTNEERGPRRRESRAGREQSGRGPMIRKGMVRLHDDVARRVWLGHPFVYKEAIDAKKILGEQGSSVDIHDWEGDFVGRGVVDGNSAIAIRVVTRNPDQEIDDLLWKRRVKAAIAMRRSLFDLDTMECLRLINGESDGFPAINVDRYGDYLLVQVGTPAVEGWLDAIYDALEEEMSPKAIYEQRRYRPLAGEAPRTGSLLVRGQAAPVEFEVSEGPLKFLVDVTSPLSTGVFADLRVGREAVARWAKDRKVLNLFSYTGAISVYAAHGGASEVTAVDVHAKSHARSRRNFTLNGFDGEKPELIVGDALKTLARFLDRGRQFDMVVIDPPAFASETKVASLGALQRTTKNSSLLASTFFPLVDC